MRRSFTVSILAGLVASASADLLIYEPFDYLPTTEVNDGRWFGDDTQPYDTGLGLGAWTHRDAAGNGLPPFPSTAPPNEGDIADEGVLFTDSSGNVLPVAGNAYERRIRVGQVAASAPVDAAATAGLTADNSTMWMTFLFQDFGFSGPDFGIGLHSEKMVGDDNQSLETAGSGVGFGIVASAGTARNIRTAVYNNSVGASQLAAEATPTFDGPTASGVFFLALKVNWNEAGTPDEIFAFIIDDIINEPDEEDAVVMDTFDFDLATQQSLDWFSFSDTQVGYVDEIRVGNTFGDVTTGFTPLPFEITGFDYDPGAEVVQLTWRSRPGKTYIAKFSTTMDDEWDADLGDGLDADSAIVTASGDLLTGTFDLTDFSVENAADLFFRIEEE